MKFARMEIEVIDKGTPARLSKLVVGSRVLAWIKAAQLENLE